MFGLLMAGCLTGLWWWLLPAVETPSTAGGLRHPFFQDGASGAGEHSFSEKTRGRLERLRNLPRTTPSEKSKWSLAIAEFARDFGGRAVPFLREFLTDLDWEVRGAALRALAVTGTAEARDLLQEYVKDGIQTEDAAQAAVGLGMMEDPAITPFLIGRFPQIQNSDVRRAVLDSLAGRSYAETAGFFQAYLRDPRPSPEEKGEVIAALGFHQAAPAETLVPWVADPREEIREGAYEALAARREGNYGQMLLGRARDEVEPSLRQKAYEAAGSQKDTLPAQMAEVVRREPDPATRLRAERAWAMTVGRSANPEDRRKFDAEAVPRLVVEALKNSDPGEQRAALQALALAGTAQAKAGLIEISQSSTSPRLAKLAQALAKKLP